jgi:integrase
MRWGELAGLQWGDVDLRSNTVRVRRAQREVYDPNARKGEKNRIELAEPKTKSSRRTIRVGSTVVRALKAHRQTLGAVPMPGARVFRAPDGAPLRRSNFIRREWKPLLDWKIDARK